MGRPITATIPRLYTTDLPILRQQFLPGRKVQISMRVEGADAVSTVKRTLRVIDAYPFYVLFQGHKGIRYTYTYPELLKKGLCKARWLLMGRDIEGQMNLFDLAGKQEEILFPACSDCVCSSCLYLWSDRCPYGKCYDDLRSEEDPYPKAHPKKPPRKEWSDWAEPGEQEHWCRGGSFSPSHWCWNYVRYTGQQVRTCLMCNVSVFQDGYIRCCWPLGCEDCYQRFEERMKKMEE